MEDIVKKLELPLLYMGTGLVLLAFVVWGLNEMSSLWTFVVWILDQISSL